MVDWRNGQERRREGGGGIKGREEGRKDVGRTAHTNTRAYLKGRQAEIK